ncbi:MAG: serine hydrolase domain-containing protein [Vulcanimicrobiaceae bacterium]
MRRWLASILTLILLSSAPAFAQTTSPIFTSAQTRAVDRIAQDEIAAHSTPGLAIGIVEDGRLVYAHGFGYANLAKKAKAGALTQFYAGALSVQFTAASILLLAQDKKLNLDDRVTKYVPEMTVARTATIRQLLQQTSGLPDYTKAPGFKDRSKPIKLDELLKAVDTLQPSFAPGTKFEYNDLNYLVAGLIVARVGRVPYSVYLQTKIFEPLVMTSSFVAGDQGISPAHAVGYTRIDGRFTPAKPWDPSWLFSANGLVSNIFDLAKWDIGFPLLLNVDSVSAMWTPSGAPGPMAYGMGWVIDQRGGHRYIWHNGQISGYHAMNALLPDDHIAVIVLTNVDQLNSQDTIAPENVASRILDVVAPLPPARADNVIMDRAKEWIDRLSRLDIDRTQLTANFNEYLTDDLVSKSNFKALGKVVSLTPVASYQETGDNVYVFLTRFEHGTFDYQFRLTPQGKVDGLLLKPPAH